MRTYSTYRRSPVLALLLPPASVSAVALRFGLWLMRCIDRSRQRASLVGLDERLLQDIGVTRAEANREAEKLFWM